MHAEADLLPGLVIDRYGDYFTVQTLDQGMDRAKGEIVGCLEELFAPSGIVERNDVAVRKREALPLVSGVLAGQGPETVTVEMNGLIFHADLLHGQKTGIFLDQRENYLAAARYARGRALDCFTSTGGFALHLASKCESVEAVDSSAASLGIAARNREANQIANIEFREADVFELLAGHAGAHRRFDLVVLDPPAFAKSRANLDAAVRGYKEINRRALELLGSGGDFGDLFLLASSERGDAAGDRGLGIARHAPQTKNSRTTHAGAGSPHPADSTRDHVPEVPDPGSALDRGRSPAHPPHRPFRGKLS